MTEIARLKKTDLSAHLRNVSLQRKSYHKICT